MIDVNLKPNKKELVFEYDTHNTKMFTTETLTVSNKSNFTAEFTFLPFEAKKPLFRMEPVTGKIKSKESAEITFFY